MTRPVPLPQALLNLFVFLFGFGLVLWIYHFAWTGTLFFDDEVNLQGLVKVFAEGYLDPSSALSFILNGEAGPLGRPLALLSFLVDGSAWGSATEAFLYTNTLLHLLNGVLLCAVLLQLGRTQGWPEAKTAWIAVLSSLLWLLTPLLASASLMIVQRMTVLSSTFMLMGMWLYLLGRARLTTHPWLAFILMSLGVGGGTLLGILTKEQAALLPVLLLTLEATLLPILTPHKPNTRTMWRLFRLVALALPTLLIALYLLRSAIQGDPNFAIRDFSMAERLWTEAVILWKYVFLTFFPRGYALTPYHDGQTIYSLTLFTALAAAAWFMLLALALKYRKRWPLFALAVLWFVAAHSLESTVLPLELYFEHRNYLAVIGALFAVVVFFWDMAASKRTMPAFALGMSIYIGLQAFVLWQTTTLYGNPRLAAELWYDDNPQSIRAAQFLAQRYSLENDPQSTLKILEDSAHRINDNAVLELQALQVACYIDKESSDSIRNRLENVSEKLKSTSISFAAIPTLQKIKEIRGGNKCKDIITDDALVKISKNLLSNPKVQAHTSSASGIHIFLATIYADQLDFNATMQSLEAALADKNTADNLNLVVTFFNSAGLYQEALTLLETHHVPESLNPILKTQQTELLNYLMQHQKELVAKNMQTSS
jgi:hypothetical protein